MLNRLAAGKRPLVPVRADRRRTLIWTPDASRGLALLGNTADAYGATWYLPVAPEHPTYREFVARAARAAGRGAGYTVVPRWVLSAAGLVSPTAREIRELLDRYAHDTVFESARFTARFPDFAVTGYDDGLAEFFRQDASGAAPTRA